VAKAFILNCGDIIELVLCAQDIVSSAKFITNDLGSLPGALGPRTTDTNKNLAIQALEMVGDLGRFPSSLCEAFPVCILKRQCHEMDNFF
jgi:hypothetical protein